MKLTIVTPEAIVYDDEIDRVTLPTLDGEITILQNHIPLITQIAPGELSIFHKSGKTDHFATGGGFAEITGSTVSVLVDLAQEATAIDEKVVEEARKRAQEALLKRQEMTDEEIATVESTLAKSLAQLKVKRRHHTRTP